MARIPGIRAVFRLPSSPQLVAQEVDEELQFHLDAQTRDLVAGGLSEAEARAEALRRFGSVPAARAELGALGRARVARTRRAEWWAALRDDLRYAVRGLGRQPAFAAAVILTLALGIGANATMFGVVDRLLLRPPAYLRDADATGRFYFSESQGRGPDGAPGEEYTGTSTSYATYQDLARDLRDRTRAFAQLAATYSTEVVLGEGARARPGRGTYVSASFWPLFDARPVRGRFFGPGEDRAPAGAPVAVLAYEFWRAAFGGDTAVVGRAVRVGPAVYTVVGVAPRGFAGVDATPPDVWLPITAAGTEVAGPEYATAYNAVWLQVIGRHHPGATRAQVDRDVRAAYGASMRQARDARALAESRPRAAFGPVLPDRGPKPGETARVAVWLAGVALVVLLVACANVASLFLARALGRGREVAVRIALGVGRGRLVAQLLTESVLLATLGAGAGLLLAQWGGGVLRATLLPGGPPAAGVVDGRTLAVILAAAPLTGLLCGLAPALAASRPALTAMLRADARAGAFPRSRLREALVVAQVALSVLLLVGAGLFVRSLRNARTLDLGFDAGHAAYVSVDLRGSGVDPSDTTGAYPRQQRALYEQLGARLRAVPGVERVGVTTALPFAITIGRRIAVPGVADVSSLGFFRYNAVGGDYFAAMGTPILRGRALDGRDRAGTERTAVVSASAARALWPGREAIGRCLKVGADTAPCRTVVGVAADLRDGTLRDDGGLHYYVAAAQGTAAERPPSGLVVRTAGDPVATIGAIRRALQPLVPGAAYVRVRPLREEVDPQFRSWQLGATLFGVFGALALLIAAVGLYGVVSYAAARRTHELGVRVALGARGAHVVRLAVGGGVRTVGVALALGLAAALAAGRFAAPLLFGVSPRDPAVLAGVTLTLLAVAALAGFVPAWRAARVSPTTALRAE